MISSDIREKLQRIEKLSTKQLFFVLGVPRSGTTWLQKALDNHPEIRCLGESHFADILFPLLQKSFQSFNRAVGRQGGTIAHLKEYGGHVATLNYDTRDLQLLLYYCMYVIFDKWVDSPDIRLIGEKTPDSIRSLNLLNTIFPKARFVHIVRDGRDCAVSAWYFNRSGMDKNKVLAQSFESYIAGFMKQWTSEVEFARRVADTLEGRYVELYYEDMLSAPVEELANVCRLLGASDDHHLISECVDNTRFEVLSGGRLAGDEDPESFFRRGLAGDWRRHLDADMSAQVWRIAGDTLSVLGYER